jgi:hypothetical protein
MRLLSPHPVWQPSAGISSAAFTLVEAIMAIAVIGILFSGLFGTIKANVSLVALCRDNQLATQILTEKVEVLRVYNWEQLNSNGFVPTNFVVALDPANASSAPYYTGRVSIVSPAPIGEGYNSNVALVTVTLNWVNEKRPQTRKVVSYVGKNGLQQYINR